MAQPTEAELEFIAQQLRTPSGEAAREVGDKMNVGNEPLFNLSLETMQLRDKERVLEIGFGTGKYVSRLFSAARDLEVQGVDPSQDMVDFSKRNNAELLESGKLKITRGNSNDLPFADESFHKVFCNMVIFFWDKPAEHLGEVHRVLKPGGKFYTGFRPRKSMLQFPFTQYGFILYEQQEWAEVLEQNGFEVLGVNSRPDPVIEDGGQDIQLESVCMVAGKK